MFSKELFKAFEGKKVLICGASGLSGHNLFDLMEVLGAKVTGTCLTDQAFTADDRPMFKVVDFTLPVDVRYLFQNDKFDYVFICCAQTYNAAMCKDNPQMMILPNIEMVSNILEASLQSGVKKVLFVSSATVYQPHTEPIAEKDLNLNLNPHPLYLGVGWTKRYLEKLCEFYSTRGLKTVVVRPTNIYGAYDKTDPKLCHVVPALIMRGLNEENPYVLRSLGDGTKNFIHAHDLTRDMAKVMAFHETPDPINLTSDEYFTIGQVVDQLIDIFKARTPGYKPHVRFEGTNDAVSFVGLNRKKFDSLYGREPYIPLAKGLKEVVEWYSLSLQTQKR